MSFIVGEHAKTRSKHKGKESKGRGFAALSDSSPFYQVLQGKNFLNPANAKGIFQSIDIDNNGRVSKGELTKWIVNNRVFKTLPEGDVMLTANRLFSDIDRDHNGTLDFSEFFRFLELIEREQRMLRYVNKHHLTSLPASYRVTNTKEFSLATIESILHEKINQLTSRDSDRYRQILTLFKHQVQRSTGKADDSTLIMTPRDFNTFLSMLGLFATREQAEMLFKKYDVNNDGSLTVHEFLTKAKPSDYPGLTLDSGPAPFEARKGKKMFSNTARYGVPVKCQTPAPEIYDMGTDSVCTRIRERLEQTARTGKAFSDQLARRKLFAALEDKDREKRMRISAQDFQTQLERRLGVVMTGPHMRALCTKYGDDKGEIDYPRLVMEVYPVRVREESTSLYRDPALYTSKQRQSASAHGGRGHGGNDPHGRNQVHLTGSYWAYASPGSPAFPPLTNPLSVRGRTPTPLSRAQSRASRSASRG